MVDLRKVLTRIKNLRDEERYLILKIKSYEKRLIKLRNEIKAEDELINNSGKGYKNGRKQSEQ